MRLTGIKLQNFRSIGEEGILLRPWAACNIIVGQNNSGKSNVIRALKKIAGLHGDNSSCELTELDLHRRDQSSSFRYRLDFHVEDNDPDAVIEITEALRTNDVYFDISVTPPSSITYVRWSGMDVTNFEVANELLLKVAQRTFNRKVGRGVIENEMKKHAEQAFTRFRSGIPNVHMIPEFRQIRPGEKYAFDGQNLISLLGEYQIPPIGKDQLREKFERIERFVQKMLHLPEASIEITRDNDLLINDAGLRLPLSSYGTGTHELVIMLVAVLSNEGDLYCIEEPEIHMHPRLQREFVQFITAETRNYYLISSHSHVFVNAIDWLDDVQVFHLETSSGASKGQPLMSDKEALQAFNDIGVRPSDILQTNCIIWVEGPSDRIHIRRWLELLSSELVEGRDYSIMFYGGRLLSHLGFEREKVPEQLIPILRISQNSIVVIDSDRSGPGGRLNRTKERVKAECNENGGYCWITDGREIENLVPGPSILRALRTIVNKEVDLKLGKYDSFSESLVEALRTANAKLIDYDSNKVKYARIIAENTGADDLQDSLINVLKDVIGKIKKWNE